MLTRGLISQLAKCRLPFQCAHGRPSVQVLSAFRRNGSGGGCCCEEREEDVRDDEGWIPFLGFAS